MPSSEPNARASKQPCARGGCCGQGRCSAWVTTGYPRESCRESWRTRGNVGRGVRRKNGRTAWLRIFGYLASRGTGTLPHLTLGPGITQYVEGCRFLAAWVKGEEKASEHRQRKREAEEADNVVVAPGGAVASLRRFRAALIG